MCCDLYKYKYMHVMNNGFHTFSILNFINKYFDNSEHCFIFPNPREETVNRLAEIDNAYVCPMEEINIEKIDKIVFHGLFTKTVIEFLADHPHWLKKSFWFIWGGDLYNAPITAKDIFVRENFAGILTSFDNEVYREKYKTNNKSFDVTYPHSQSELSLKAIENKAYIHIQVNNCEDETTLEMLDILTKYKNENIKVSTILSYKSTGHKDVAKEILEKGYSIFKEKFNPLQNYLPIEEYSNHLASVDIYISNQNRQQGNGNAAVLCSLGKKVFVKSDTSVYKKYSELGIKYYDTYKIKDLSYKDFIFQDDKIREVSVKRLRDRMKDETKVNQWKSFFLSV